MKRPVKNEFKSILVLFHCGSNTGYAIASLEKVFYEMSIRLIENIENIHFGYKSTLNGRPKHLPDNFCNIIEMDLAEERPHALKNIGSYIRSHNIECVFCFDSSVGLSIYDALRRNGAHTIIGYYGAPMSPINWGLKLLLKKAEVLLRSNKPDFYIFESISMQDTAIYGRGVPRSKTAVVHLGVDTDKYFPDESCKSYAYDSFSVPKDRKIAFFSGHMEPRKGVDVIIKAAVELIDKRGRTDVHFLLLGNQAGDFERLYPLYKNTRAEGHITFAGYRNDVSMILKSCYIGVIASTGWDSFTMSSLEMASTGLPLVVSDLQGLSETVESNVTGIKFTPGNYVELADATERLLSDSSLQKKMKLAARKRIVDFYTVNRQVNELVTLVRNASNGVVRVLR